LVGRRHRYQAVAKWLHSNASAAGDVATSLTHFAQNRLGMPLLVMATTHRWHPGEQSLLIVHLQSHHLGRFNWVLIFW
jgi:hypothetical protein